MVKTVLIIEDDETQRVMLSVFLKSKMGLDCYMAENGRKGLEILSEPRAKSIRLVISDIEMPVMNGIDALRHIKDDYPSLPVIMLTGSKNMNHAIEAMKLGATDFVAKPYDNERMVVTVQNALKMQAMNAEIKRLQHDEDGRFTFDQMIGHDGGLKDVVKMGRKAAMVDLPALILGETGTGKELFAKAIHGESEQSGEAFIAVNCGAIPSDLVESILFGHEKGAFTGATDAAIGKFREADGGTLFLDEVGELPMEAQVKLLRILQEKEVEPVGASRAVKVNVRVISATHRDLSADVDAGLFREDLYYRLNVLEMEIPPLRVRSNDIVLLADHFLSKIAIQANLPLKTVTENGMAALMGHGWRGNVRELENTINRAFVLNDEDELNGSDWMLRKEGGGNDIQPTEINDDEPLVIKTMDEVECDMMRLALEKYDNNITQASKALGIAKSTFYRKAKALRLSDAIL